MVSRSTKNIFKEVWDLSSYYTISNVISDNMMSRLIFELILTKHIPHN